MITIRDLYKYYGSRRAVGPVSADIEHGEVIGLLGLNAAGKTTTLRILACDLLPTSGTVKVDGIDVVEAPHEVRGMVGYLPESPPLYGEMTVDEYLQFVAALRGVRRSDISQWVRQAERVTGVRRVRNQAIGSLSHGFRQRLGIAQAIVHRPKLVVLDEPSSGLDPVQIVEMRKLVRSLGGDHTVIVSSHILAEISEICDRILVIRDGEVCAAGTEEELSAMLLTGMRVDVTLRLDDRHSRTEAERLLGRVRGVRSIASMEATESGDGIASFQVECGEDVRDELCRALVGAELQVLGIARAARELESVFLRLSEATDRGGPTTNPPAAGERPADHSQMEAGA